MSTPCDLSIVLATHNRPDVLARTLHKIAALPRDGVDIEIIVVDNNSKDDVSGMVRRHPRARFLRLSRNRGSCAKAVGVAHARGQYILFLDDDSAPRPGAFQTLIERFVADPALGAAGFAVHLPDGRQESAALPHVFVGCGVGLRAEALRDAGGLDATFFMQAEEYDLSFRMARAGWKVDVFADLAVDHDKSPRARRAERTAYYDMRNNLRVIARYLPEPYRSTYVRDWTERYLWMAKRDGHLSSVRRGLHIGRLRGLVERVTFARRRLDDETCERFFRWEAIECRMRALRRHGVRRIVLADLGKNIWPYVRGATRSGIDVLCIADDGFAGHERRYREIPLSTTMQALAMSPDAIVVSNMSYAHADRRTDALRQVTRIPILNWTDGPKGPSRVTGRFESNADCDSGIHLQMAL